MCRLFFLFFVGNVFATDLANEMPQFVPIDFEKLHASRGKNVRLEGFIFFDREIFLFSDLNSLNSFSDSERVIMRFDSPKDYINLHGCFVSVIGRLKFVDGKSPHFVVDDVKNITRTGLLYSEALRRNPSKEPRCYLSIMSEIMSN